MNTTLAKFGYPATLIHDYVHWSVLLRPQQATLGALVLVNREPATAFSQIAPASFTELGTVVADIEAALSACFGYDRINYLMLMMVDPDVHFHVLPRYHELVSFAGTPFQDPGWPGPPDLGFSNEIDEQNREAVRAMISEAMLANRAHVNQ